MGNERNHGGIKPVTTKIQNYLQFSSEVSFLQY